MSQKLVNHNEDLLQLVKKGYAVDFDSNYLVVRDIPYLNESGDRCIGAIVSKMVNKDELHVAPHDHQIFFAGGVPHQINGKPIVGLGGGEATLALSSSSPDLIVERSFSMKLKEVGTPRNYRDFFEKIETYVNIISGPAIALHDVTPLTFRKARQENEDSVFKIADTLTSLAEITDLSAKFEQEVVAVIGLGGTGAYVLDFVAKTPVKEVRGFDGDVLHVHNVFRSPGKFDESEFDEKKAEIYQARYENLRHGITLKSMYIDSSSASELEGVTFAFVCVDKGSSRKEIFDLLIELGIPFIDVGMGLSRREEMLDGMLRTTYFSDEKSQEIRDLKLAAEADAPDDLYKINVQIGELNALNACLAVIRYKQILGFYFDESPYYNVILKLGSLKLFYQGEDDED